MDLVTEPYMRIYKDAKESGLFENEQALQSAIASMYIRYNQLIDKNPNFNKLVEDIRNHVKREPAILNDIIRYVYADLMKKSKKAELYINEKLQEPIPDLIDFDKALRDYLNRNHIDYKIVFDIIPIEEE